MVGSVTLSVQFSYITLIYQHKKKSCLSLVGLSIILSLKEYIDKDENTNSLNCLESLGWQVLILSILVEGVPAI